VPVALTAADLLQADGVAARVVSVPWRERFLSSGCRDVLLPPGVPRVVIEAAAPDGWRALAGPAGEVIGLRQPGAAPGSAAPGPVVTVGPCFSPEGIRAVAHDVILAAAHAPW
jgi:transketolase